MSDQKPEELKPCLHCNKTPELPADWMDLAYTEDLDEFAIRCSPGCGATGPIVELPEGIDDLEDYQNFSLILGELVKAWNRRGEQPKPPIIAPAQGDAPPYRMRFAGPGFIEDARTLEGPGIKRTFEVGSYVFTGKDVEEMLNTAYSEGLAAGRTQGDAPKGFEVLDTSCPKCGWIKQPSDYERGFEAGRTQLAESAGKPTWEAGPYKPSAPQPAPTRDLTAEEADAKAKKLWGENAGADWRSGYARPAFVFGGTDGDTPGRWDHEGEGQTFREAFTKAGVRVD